MKKTLYYNPFVTIPMKLVTWLLLKILGWNFVGEIIPEKKAMIISAPHSSNWDAVLLLCMAFKYNLKIHYLAKKEAFRFPFTWIIQKSGGIAVNRNRASRLVFEVAKKIKEEEEIFLAITPEGTRNPDAEWKTGFYHMAMKAEVPFQVGSINYLEKTVYLSYYYPVGDYDTDIAALKQLCEPGFRRSGVIKAKQGKKNQSNKSDKD